MSIILGLLLASVAVCAYLLWVLHSQLRKVYHGIWAWRFIFAGYALLMAELLWGLVLLGNGFPFEYGLARKWGSEVFMSVMLVKLVCYAVGFTLWARQRKAVLSARRWWENPPTSNDAPKT